MLTFDRRHQTMSSAFVGAPLPMFQRQQQVRTSLNTRRLRAQPVRRTFPPHTACLAASKEPGASEEEEVLDEAAMRAAEIHEVLSGLKEFKDRIVNGTFTSRLMQRVETKFQCSFLFQAQLQLQRLTIRLSSRFNGLDFSILT